MFHLTDKVFLTAGDVRSLQLAKAAVAAGVQVLLAQQGITLAELDGVYLAGGFGVYLDPASAAAIACAVVYVFPRPAVVVCMALLCALIGGLRVLSGQHDLSDVLAALALSLALSLAGYLL